MNTSPFPTRSHLSPNPAIHIRQLHCICSYLDSKTASTVTISIVHSKLDYSLSLYHNLPKSQITRLQQIQNSLAHAVAKAPKSSHISHPTPLAKNNWAHWIQAPFTYLTEFLQPPYLLICITSLQLSLIAALALHLWSHSLVHLHSLSSRNNQSFLPVCLPLSLESTPGFCLSATH